MDPYVTPNCAGTYDIDEDAFFANIKTALPYVYNHYYGGFQWVTCP
ncbi:MAG: hypothetical protein WCV88_03335 [Patescibacteria group bacterium]